MALADKISGQARRLRELLARTSDVQQHTLRDILTRNQSCEYGERHEFRRIRTYDEFRSRVPIVGYEELRADIARMAIGQPNVLVASAVVAFEETGGTSAGRKLVPHTVGSLEAFRRPLTAWLDDLYESDPLLQHGTAYWAISPAGRTPRICTARVPVGLSDADYFGPWLAPEIAHTLSVQPSVALLTDLDEWRAATMTQLLADEALALISVWSPTFLLMLLHYAVARGAELYERISREASAGRAQRIRAALSAHEPDFRAIWPHLRLISCWDQASSRGPARELARHFPDVTIQGKGLLATEGIVSIPLTDSQMPVLAIESGFYEFLGADGTCHCASDLAPGEQYEVLLTNSSGLYRYAIGDRVLVHGFVGTAPTLEFVGRAGVISDRCGEKLSEDFIVKALNGTDLVFATLAADSAGYVLLVDSNEVSDKEAATLCAQIDLQLRANPQYAYACDLQQLAPVRPALCRNPMDSFVGEALARGRRLGDVKPPALYTNDNWRRVFNVLT
jgi:GH3 auxin-responsive promoter